MCRFHSLMLVLILASSVTAQTSSKNAQIEKAKESIENAEQNLQAAQSRFSSWSRNSGTRTYSDAYSYQQQLIYFLMNPRNQKDLELSADQKQQLTNANKRLSAGYKEIYAKFPELKDSKLDTKKRAELTKTLYLEYNKLRAKIDDELRETLVPQQLVMLKKLQFNQSILSMGFSSTLSRKPFQEEFETTEKQQEALKKIRLETEQEIQKLIAEKRKAAKDKMRKVLNAKQRKKLEEFEADSPKSGYIRL